MTETVLASGIFSPISFKLQVATECCTNSYKDFGSSNAGAKVTHTLTDVQSKHPETKPNTQLHPGDT